MALTVSITKPTANSDLEQFAPIDVEASVTGGTPEIVRALLIQSSSVVDGPNDMSNSGGSNWEGTLDASGANLGGASIRVEALTVESDGTVSVTIVEMP